MFSHIDDVPAPIRDFYDVKTKIEPVLDENDDVVMVEEEYQYIDESGIEQTGTRLVPKMQSVDYVVQVPWQEQRTMSDVFAVIAAHKGKRDDLIVKFLELNNNRILREFHDDYLEWFLTPQVLPTDIEPIAPPVLELIDVGYWMRQNYELLRLAAYPSKEKQFEMQFDDLRDGSTLWVDAISAIKTQYPKLTK